MKRRQDKTPDSTTSQGKRARHTDLSPAPSGPEGGSDTQAEEDTTERPDIQLSSLAHKLLSVHTLEDNEASKLLFSVVKQSYLLAKLRRLPIDWKNLPTPRNNTQEDDVRERAEDETTEDGDIDKKNTRKLLATADSIGEGYGARAKRLMELLRSDPKCKAIPRNTTLAIVEKLLCCSLGKEGHAQVRSLCQLNENSLQKQGQQDYPPLETIVQPKVYYLRDLQTPASSNQVAPPVYDAQVVKRLEDILSKYEDMSRAPAGSTFTVVSMLDRYQAQLALYQRINMLRKCLNASHTWSQEEEPRQEHHMTSDVVIGQQFQAYLQTEMKDVMERYSRCGSQGFVNLISYWLAYYVFMRARKERPGCAKETDEAKGVKSMRDTITTIHMLFILRQEFGCTGALVLFTKQHIGVWFKKLRWYQSSGKSEKKQGAEQRVLLLKRVVSMFLEIFPEAKEVGQKVESLVGLATSEALCFPSQTEANQFLDGIWGKGGFIENYSNVPTKGTAS